MPRVKKHRTCGTFKPKGYLEMKLRSRIKGPDPGVSPGWWDRQNALQREEVQTLTEAQVDRALKHLCFPKQKLSRRSLAKKRAILRRALFGKNRFEAKANRRDRKREREFRRLRCTPWEKLSRLDRQSQIEEVQMSYGEAGRRISRAGAERAARRFHEDTRKRFGC